MDDRRFGMACILLGLLALAGGLTAGDAGARCAAEVAAGEASFITILSVKRFILIE